jgi:signal transduction histidine kinase
MTLRARLFLTSLLIAVPLAVGWFALDTRTRLATKEQELRQSVEFDVSAGLRERCEADPPRTGRPGRGGGAPLEAPAPEFRPPGPPPPEARGQGPGRGAGPRGPARGGAGAYEFFAYNADGTPTAADAPPLPANPDGAIASTFWAGSGFGVALVVPLGGQGRCAFLLARIPPRPGELRDQVEALALVVFSVLAAAWFAAGPVISKLRRLADGVRQSAASHYAEPVAVKGPDEVAALADAFNEAGARVRAHVMDVQAREEALRGFVANTTNDVAIPLTVLQGHLAELDRALAEMPAHREHVRAAVQEAHYMASLLRNLGAAITLEESRAPIVLSPVDLSALVDRVVARHRPIARASDVELNVAVPDPPLVASTDLTLLEQALGNLVDNAFRYNHAGGHVAVLLDRAGDGFVLSVTDDGPGVTDEELAQLTTRWFRGSDARTRRPDGKGLGLAIVNESVKRLGLTLAFGRPVVGGLRAEIRQHASPPRSDAVQ